jgi:CheY-like chemotaxis protein
MRILIVDDEAPIRDSLQEILESEGFEVELAGDGLQALQILTDSEFDLVLSDIKMPRMDGMELLTHLAKNWTSDKTRIIKERNIKSLIIVFALFFAHLERIE